MAYFAARHAGRYRGLVLLLLILPFWINYLMRMLAWINLLSPDGLGTRMLSSLGIERLFIFANLLSSRGGWLEGQPFTVIMALTYGYLPFLILPLYAVLDRIDQRQIEAARDLGASPASAFRRVTLPLSRPGILAGLVLIALPMFGDYYTPDLVSSSTKTIDDRKPDRPAHAPGLGEGRRRLADIDPRAGAARADVLLPPLDPQRRRPAGGRVMSRLRNPWGKPRFLVLVTAVYVLWSLIPVAIAILFAFNNGRSRTTWQGFSTRWFTGESGSVLHDPALQGALRHTLFLGVVCVLVATPLGVALALGLQRWRGPGGGTINTVMLLPLVTPEIVMGVALLLLFLQVLPGIGLGSTAQAIGQVTFTLSYVVVIVRGRLVSIGKDYEEAAADLGAPPHDQLLRVVLPLLAPAIIASAAVVFAISLDDFVVTQYLSGDASTTTVSMLLYASARGRADTGPERARHDCAPDHADDARARLSRLPSLREQRRCDGDGWRGGLEPMQGEIQLEELTKKFGDVAAVDGIDLQMPAGEFFTMVGPSGCGKTTTLRMIAGFERPTSGRIVLDDVDVAQVPPHKRNVNTVFQSYALFPHLDVAGNVAFGLKYKKLTQGGAAPARCARRSRSSSSGTSRSASRRSSRAGSSSASRSRARSC